MSGEAIFEVEGRPLRAPKALLCARCPHYRAMFGSGMRESRGETVKIYDASYCVYRALLDYLLCDEIAHELEVESLAELLMLSNAYGVSRLEFLSARKLATKIDDQNVDEILQCAVLIGEVHLQRACERFRQGAAEAVSGSAARVAPTSASKRSPASVTAMTTRSTGGVATAVTKMTTMPAA